MNDKMTAVLVRMTGTMKQKAEQKSRAGAMSLSTYIRRLLARDLGLPKRSAVLRSGRRQGEK